MVKVNGTREQLEFKSHQWFGATVRTHRGKVVVSVSENVSPINGPNEAISVMLIGNILLYASLALVFSPSTETQLKAGST